MNAVEKENASPNVVSLGASNQVLVGPDQKSKKAFTFNYIYGEDSTQVRLVLWGGCGLGCLAC